MLGNAHCSGCHTQGSTGLFGRKANGHAQQKQLTEVGGQAIQQRIGQLLRAGLLRWKRMLTDPSTAQTVTIDTLLNEIQ